MEAKLNLIRAENEIQQLIEQDRFNTSQQAANAERRTQLNLEIQSLNDDIAAKDSELQALQEQLSSLSADREFSSQCLPANTRSFVPGRTRTSKTV